MGDLTIPPYVPPVTPGATLNGQSRLAAQQETFAAAGSMIPVVYGEQWVGGRIFTATYAGGFWYVGALFCVGEIDSYVTLYLNGAAVPAGVTVTYYTGTTSQTADATLAAVFPGYADTLVVSNERGSVGIAYVVLKYTDQHFGSFPTILARIKGRKVLPLSENLLLYSEQLDNAVWAQTPDADLNVTANALTAPDGATTAEKIIEATTATALRYIQQNVTGLLDNEVVTASGFFKAGERYARLGFINKANGHNYVAINLATGAVLGTGGNFLYDYGARDMGNGWYRAWVTTDARTGGTSPGVRVQLIQTDGTASYAGVVNSGVYAWGLQIERHRAMGVYTLTTTAATAAAYSDNPARCARDFIRNRVFGVGEATDDLAFLALSNECDALVTAEKRRTLALIIDNARTIKEWVDTFAAYCGGWIYKRGNRWTARPDRPAHLWTFDSASEGWGTLNATVSVSGGSLVATGLASSMQYLGPNLGAYGMNLCGSQAYTVRCRARRTAGSSAWNGYLFWKTALHASGFTTTYRATAPDPGVANGTWFILEWDMRASAAGGAEWIDAIIPQIRIDLFNGALNEVWELDWVSIGVRPVTLANVVAGSAKAAIADRASVPSSVRVAYTDTAELPFREREYEAVLAGVATGTVPLRESRVSMPGVVRYSQAKREATERLNKLQRTTQLEFTLFDEGLALEQGDLLTVMHPFLNTGSTAECAAATLMRVIAEPSVTSPGRVAVRAIGYSAADYDDTESTTTWGDTDARLGTGLSGDGINRMLPRFAGNWNKSEPDSRFPTTRGAGCSFSAIGYGSAPDPTAGFYGANAMKLATNAVGSGRLVYFGASTTDYNVVIEPNSRWIISAKVWATVASTVAIGMKTSAAGATYPVNLGVGAGQVSTWLDLSGVADLTADASTKAVIYQTFNQNSAQCWTDGIMIERQIGPGTTPTPFRMPATHNVYPTTISTNNLNPGMLLNGFSMDQGDGVARPLVYGIASGEARDGDAVTFTKAYASIPTVIWLPGAFTSANGVTGESYLSCEAKDLSTTGFTARIKVVGLSGAQTTVTETGGAAGATYDYEMDKATATTAYDDRYTFQFDVSIKNGDKEPVGNGSYIWEPGYITVGIYIALSSGVWSKVGEITVHGETNAATTAKTNRTITVHKDGLTNHAGKEFAIDKIADLYGGSSITSFDSVTYATATAPTEAAATAAAASGGAKVPYLVIGSPKEVA